MQFKWKWPMIVFWKFSRNKPHPDHQSWENMFPSYFPKRKSKNRRRVACFRFSGPFLLTLKPSARRVSSTTYFENCIKIRLWRARRRKIVFPCRAPLTLQDPTIYRYCTFWKQNCALFKTRACQFCLSRYGKRMQNLYFFLCGFRGFVHISQSLPKGTTWADVLFTNSLRFAWKRLWVENN